MSDTPSDPKPLGMTFAEFVLSIGTNAAVMLGGDEDGDTVRGKVDLVSASQYIDILAMLKEKTVNNLTADESALLDSILYDLRMRYLQMAQQRPSA